MVIALLMVVNVFQDGMDSCAFPITALRTSEIAMTWLDLLVLLKINVSAQ